MRSSRTRAALLALVMIPPGCGSDEGTPTDPFPPSFGMAPTTDVVFQAELSRTNPVSVSCSLGICDIVGQGTGAANLMGPVTYATHIVQDFTTSPCQQALVELTLIGATGTIDIADVEGSVCAIPGPHEASVTFISSRWQVVGGTGQFAGISGSGHNRGPIGGQGPVVHIEGVVSY